MRWCFCFVFKGCLQGVLNGRGDCHIILQRCQDRGGLRAVGVFRQSSRAAALSVGRGDSVPRLLLSRFMTWAVLLVLEPFTEAI